MKFNFVRLLTFFIIVLLVLTAVLILTTARPINAMASPTARSVVFLPAVQLHSLPQSELVILDPLAILAIILVIAFIVESTVEFFFAPLFDNIPTLSRFKWIQMYIALGIGVLGSNIYQFDVIYLVGMYFKQPIPVTMFGVILTGLAIGKGSNYLHDLIFDRILKPKPEATA